MSTASARRPWMSWRWGRATKGGGLSAASSFALRFAASRSEPKAAMICARVRARRIRLENLAERTAKRAPSAPICFL